MITPNTHERAEWARFAQAAYLKGETTTGHRYSAHSAIGGSMPVHIFDALQTHYRNWLVFGYFPPSTAKFATEETE